MRHPLYVGWLLTVWSASVMTVAHFFFAAMTTAYILMAIRFEEADLIAVHGEKYQRYRKQIPMIAPALGLNATLGKRDAPVKTAAVNGRMLRVEKGAQH